MRRVQTTCKGSLLYCVSPCLRRSPSCVACPWAARFFFFRFLFAFFPKVDLLRQAGREKRLGGAYAAAAASAGASPPPTDGADGADGDGDGADGETLLKTPGSGMRGRSGMKQGGAAGDSSAHAHAQAQAQAQVQQQSGARLSAPVHYCAFDYSAECPAGRTHRLARLYSQLEPFLEESSFFLRVSGPPAAPEGPRMPLGSPLKSPLKTHAAAAVGANPPNTPARRAADDAAAAAAAGGGASLRTLMRRQSGVVRTNCLDCIDRTNLVQARHPLPPLSETPIEAYPSPTHFNPFLPTATRLLPTSAPDARRRSWASGSSPRSSLRSGCCRGARARSRSRLKCRRAA